MDRLGTGSRGLQDLRAGLGRSARTELRPPDAAGSLFLPPDHSGLDALCSSWTEHIQGGPWVKGSGKVQAEIRYFLSSFAGEPLILAQAMSPLVHREEASTS